MFKCFKIPYSTAVLQHCLSFTYTNDPTMIGSQYLFCIPILRDESLSSAANMFRIKIVNMLILWAVGALRPSIRAYKLFRAASPKNQKSF